MRLPPSYFTKLEHQWATLHSAETPSRLFHYTPLESLEQIWRTREIHLGEHGKLNDSREFSFGLNIFVEQLKKKPPTINNPNATWDRFTSFLDQEKTPQIGVYIFSLSELSDSEELWQRYGNQGRGVSIGFVPAELRDPSTNERAISNVIYDSTVQKRIALEIYNRLCLTEGALIDSADERDYGEITGRLASATFNASFIQATRFKEPEPWSVEREWRIVQLSRRNHPNVLHKVVNGQEKAFYKQEVPKISDLISSITLGPECSTLGGLEALIAEQGISIARSTR